MPQLGTAGSNFFFFFVKIERARDKLALSYFLKGYRFLFSSHNFHFKLFKVTPRTHMQHIQQTVVNDCLKRSAGCRPVYSI